VDVEAPGHFSPFLMDGVEQRIAAAENEHPTWNVLERLPVVCPANAARQLQIRHELIIGFSETGPRIEIVRVLAAEIVVPLPVKIRDRIGIDIGSHAPRPAEAATGVGREVTRQTKPYTRRHWN